jgi:outer membrane protein
MNRLPALALLVVAGAAPAQQAGDTTVNAGWINVSALHSNGSVHTDLRPSLIGSALGIPDSFDSSGTSASVSDVNTLGISFTHFLSDQFTLEFDGGIPAKIRVYGEGVVAPPGLAGQLFQVDLGDPSVNPLGSARQWSPAVLLQYRFGGTDARIRPFAGIGLTYTWFTEVALSPAFEERLNSGVGRMLALAAGKPGPTSVAVDADPVWKAVFSAGAALALDRHWGLAAAAAYVPFVTKAVVEIRAEDGTVLSTSRPRIGIEALITGLLLTYRF